MLRNGLEPSIEKKLARLILGRNIFTETDWMNYYDAKFSERQLREAGKFPLSEDILSAPCPFNAGKTVKETHFAFLGLQNLNGKRLTVLGWHELHTAGQPNCYFFDQNPWYADQPYVVEPTCNERWYLTLKDIVPGSEDRTPEEQEAMLPPEYEISTTAEEVAKNILVVRKTDVRPNPYRWARCKEKTVKTAQVPDGSFSCVGLFGGYGLPLQLERRPPLQRRRGCLSEVPLLNLERLRAYPSCLSEPPSDFFGGGLTSFLFFWACCRIRFRNEILRFRARRRKNYEAYTVYMLNNFFKAVAQLRELQ